MNKDEYVENIINESQRKRMSQLIKWTENNYPDGHFEVKWNQPMFLLKNTYIIAYSVAKNHITVGTEGYELELFREEIEKKYKAKKMTFIIKNSEEIDYELLRELIDFKIKDKKDSESFWK